jgi:hypothetical protein
MAAIPGEEAGNLVSQAQSEATGAIAEMAESLGLIATSAVMEINQILNALDNTVFSYKVPYKREDGTVAYFEIKLSILRIFGLFAAFDVLRRYWNGDKTVFGEIYSMIVRIMEMPQAFSGGMGGLSGIQMPNVGAGIAGVAGALAAGVQATGEAAGKWGSDRMAEYQEWRYMMGIDKRPTEPGPTPSKQVPYGKEGALRPTISDEEQRLRDQFIIDRVAGKAQLPPPKPKETR